MSKENMFQHISNVKHVIPILRRADRNLCIVLLLPAPSRIVWGEATSQLPIKGMVLAVRFVFFVNQILCDYKQGY